MADNLISRQRGSVPHSRSLVDMILVVSTRAESSPYTFDVSAISFSFSPRKLNHCLRLVVAC